MSLSEIWYYALPDGSAVGPLSKSALERMAREGAIGRDTLVWDGGQFEWRPLHRASALLGGGPAPRSTPASKPGSPPGESSSAATRPVAADQVVARTPQSEKTQRRAAVEQQRQDRLAQKQQAKTSKPAPFVPVGATAPSPPPPAPTIARAERAPANKPAQGAAAEGSAERVPLALRRWLARGIDIATLGVVGAGLVTLLLSAFLAELSEPAWQAWREPGLLAWLALLALIPLEALALTLFGRTPGKALLGIHLQAPGGRSLGLFAALTRSWQVAVKGMLLGIPPLTLLAQGWGFVRVVNDNQTAWDQAAGSQPHYAALSGHLWLAALAALLVSWSALLSGETAQLLVPLLLEVLPLVQG